MTRASIAESWRRVVEQIPSRWFTSSMGAGFRLALAERAAAQRATRYLEVGCRRGHSLAMVALAAQRLERATVVDAWVPQYGDETNPGAEAVERHLMALGVDTVKISFLTGNSHDILPALEASYCLILVDGDHTPEGAAADLHDCFTRLEMGGILVFDDAIGELLTVWRHVASRRPVTCTEHLDDSPPWCEARAGMLL